MELSDILGAFTQTEKKITRAANDCNRPKEQITLIAVSKQQQEDRIEASLAIGHRVFGENRVQEAQKRWANRKNDYPDLCLHLIGPLQSNKTADAVRLFDVIHTIDRPKIAIAIAKEAAQQNKYVECFIQVNTGDEPQKSGISPCDLSNFVDFCQEEAGLSIKGLMCIPPVYDDPINHFSKLKSLADENKIDELSIGMSDDYEIALKFNPTYIRLGTILFGNRL